MSLKEQAIRVVGLFDVLDKLLQETPRLLGHPHEKICSEFINSVFETKETVDGFLLKNKLELDLLLGEDPFPHLLIRDAVRKIFSKLNFGNVEPIQKIEIFINKIEKYQEKNPVTRRVSIQLFDVSPSLLKQEDLSAQVQKLSNDVRSLKEQKEKYTKELNNIELQILHKERDKESQNCLNPHPKLSPRSIAKEKKVPKTELEDQKNLSKVQPPQRSSLHFLLFTDTEKWITTFKNLLDKNDHFTHIVAHYPKIPIIDKKISDILLKGDNALQNQFKQVVVVILSKKVTGNVRSIAEKWHKNTELPIQFFFCLLL